jgi:hypothetical protein
MCFLKRFVFILFTAINVLATANAFAQSSSSVSGQILYLPFASHFRDSALTRTLLPVQVGAGLSFESDALGRSAQAGFFSGEKGAYLTVSDAAVLRLDRDFTIVCYLRPENKGVQHSQFTILSKLEQALGSDLVSGYEIQVQDNRLTFETSSLHVQSKFKEYLSTRELRYGVWQQVAVSFNGYFIQLYIDGEPAGAFQRQTPISMNKAPLRIGQRSSFDAGAGALMAYKGGLDEIMVFNRVLDQQDLKNLALTNPAPVEVKEIIRPKKPNEAVFWAAFHFFDAETKAPLPFVKVLLPSPMDTVLQSNSHKAGLFLNSRSAFKLEAILPGYMPLDSLIQPAQEDSAGIFTLFLSKVEVNKAMVLDHVLFVQSKPELLPESFSALDRLCLLMQENPQSTIFLSGHTDNQGDPRLNVQLSEQRVETVKNYLVAKGIAATRITGKGFGGSRPMAPNNTEDNRRKNRRVECTVTSL